MKPANKLEKTLLALTAVAVLSACGSAPVVGVLLPTTGAQSTFGESMKRGIDLALEDLQGDLPEGFEVRWGDSGSDPAVATAALEQMASEGAKLIVMGTTSGTARALLPILDDADLLAVSPSASAPSLTKDSRRFFRVFASDELEGRRAGRFLYDGQDKTSVLIYAEDSDQARGIEPPFRQVFEQAMGGEVVGRVVVNNNGWENESEDLLAAGQPESIYIIGYSDKTIEVLRHLREKGYDGLICAGSSFYTGQVLEDHPELVEGVFFPQPAFDMQSDSPLTQRFISTYRQRFQQDPDIYAAHAYDAMRVVAWVANHTKSFTTNDMRKVLGYGMDEFPGVTGIIQFNEYGDVHHNPIMFIIKDGHVLNYESYIDEERSKIRDRIKDLLGG